MDQNRAEKVRINIRRTTESFKEALTEATKATVALADAMNRIEPPPWSRA